MANILASKANKKSSGNSKEDDISRRQRLKHGLQRIGQGVQKLNLGKLINEMEKDQELADRLESINQESNEEIKRKAIVEEAVQRCHREITNHLDSFLSTHPHATYEEWIYDLHPENVQQGKILDDLFTVDPRFYVQSSDHRLLWNDKVPHKQVPSRSNTMTNALVTDSVDLLDDSIDALEDVELHWPT
jgi:hypothetical protein